MKNPPKDIDQGVTYDLEVDTSHTEAPKDQTSRVTRPSGDVSEVGGSVPVPSPNFPKVVDLNVRIAPNQAGSTERPLFGCVDYSAGFNFMLTELMQ